MLTHLQAVQRAEEIESQIAELVASSAKDDVLDKIEALMGEVTVKYDADKGVAHFHGLVTEKQTVPSFRKMLTAMKGKSEIRLHINSVGGSPTAGVAIYNMLRAADQNITTISDGQSYSAASLIFMAGDKRLIANSAIVGIHRARRVAVLADADDMLAGAEQLEQIDKAMLEIYTSNGTDGKADEIKAAMWQDSMIGMKRAKELGLATGAAPKSMKREIVAEAQLDKAEPEEPATEATAEVEEEVKPQNGVSLSALGIYGHI